MSYLLWLRHIYLQVWFADIRASVHVHIHTRPLIQGIQISNTCHRNLYNTSPYCCYLLVVRHYHFIESSTLLIIDHHFIESSTLLIIDHHFIESSTLLIIDHHFIESSTLLIIDHHFIESSTLLIIDHHFIESSTLLIIDHQVQQLQNTTKHYTEPTNAQ